MRILSVIVPLICATNVLGIQWMLPNHQDRLFTLSVLVGAVVNVAVNFFAIPAAGALGASIATVAAEASVLLFQAWAVRDVLAIRRYALGALPFAAIGTLMLVAIRVFAGIVGARALTVFGLVLEVALGAAVYLALVLLWCRLRRPREFVAIMPRLARWLGIDQ
jgi:O-antigen/teichoic acid export membrane protein